MNRWEYQIEDAAVWDIDCIVSFLNEQGDNGWELVAVVGRTYYLKRPVNPSKDKDLDDEEF